MRKIYKESQLLELIKYPREVIKSIGEIIFMLNDNYGQAREVDNDLGGYVVIANEELSKFLLK